MHSRSSRTLLSIPAGLCLVAVLVAAAGAANGSGSLGLSGAAAARIGSQSSGAVELDGHLSTDASGKLRGFGLDRAGVDIEAAGEIRLQAAARSADPPGAVAEVEAGLKGEAGALAAAGPQAAGDLQAEAATDVGAALGADAGSGEVDLQARTDVELQAELGSEASVDGLHLDSVIGD